MASKLVWVLLLSLVTVTVSFAFFEQVMHAKRSVLYASHALWENRVHNSSGETNLYLLYIYECRQSILFMYSWHACEMVVSSIPSSEIANPVMVLYTRKRNSVLKPVYVVFFVFSQASAGRGLRVKVYLGIIIACDVNVTLFFQCTVWLACEAIFRVQWYSVCSASFNSFSFLSPAGLIHEPE